MGSKYPVLKPTEIINCLKKFGFEHKSPIGGIQDRIFGICWKPSRIACGDEWSQITAIPLDEGRR